MGKFLELEGGYLVIALFILVVTTFVTTRDFVGDGKAWKKAVPLVGSVLLGFILSHYFFTVDRMESVKERFKSGGAVICESRMIRKVAQSIIIDPKKPQGWVLEGDEFKSPLYSRVFHSARCLIYRNPEEKKQTIPKGSK